MVSHHFRELNHLNGYWIWYHDWLRSKLLALARLLPLTCSDQGLDILIILANDW